MTFLRIFKHLLPNARAWRITVDKKLRQFFDGLSGAGNSVKLFFDNVWLDIFPQTTRELDDWETQWGLRDTGLTEQERRDRLDATWKALGGQDPRYIQDTLQANGFDVYVHEWWEPDTNPPVVRNPLLHIRRGSGLPSFVVECGMPLAQCGEPSAEAGAGIGPTGYPLVNKIFITAPDILPLCGEAIAEAGEPDALCGNYFQFRFELREYIVPADPNTWPYFLYIGGETFGDLAQVDPKRKDEFEALCLKICPAQQWLGIIVEFV